MVQESPAQVFDDGAYMIAVRANSPLGWRVYGLGIMAMAAVWLAWGKFDPSQGVPESFPGHTILAYAVAAFTLLAGAALEWRRTSAYAAGALTIYYTLVVVILTDGPGLIDNYAEYGSYSGIAAQVAIAAGALIVYAAHATISAALAARLTRVGQLTFGVCALLFGGAHFYYLNLTVPLIPKWLPPSRDFWAYATGIAHIAAGLAILTGVQARRAGILLTIMYALFTPLVHVPALLADPFSYWNWSENSLNLALVGVAWVVADSLARPVP
jgi:uncharacterized membrane protein YphA (DoxX/SURF4 family)